MTQNEKDLLLKDLCARLPYGVIVGTTDNDGTIPNFLLPDMYNRLTEDVRLINCDVDAARLTDFYDVRPYLLPPACYPQGSFYPLSDGISTHIPPDH